MAPDRGCLKGGEPPSRNYRNPVPLDHPLEKWDLEVFVIKSLTEEYKLLPFFMKGREKNRDFLARKPRSSGYHVIHFGPLPTIRVQSHLDSGQRRSYMRKAIRNPHVFDSS